MPQVSVVIITKNEAINIVDCILSAKKISSDIIVVDSRSMDATVLLAKREQVKVESISWKGYGNARNTGAMLAANDWILALDADERITDELAESIATTKFSDHHIIYGFKRINYFADKKDQVQALAHDRVFRLYNKKYSQWDLVPVHEKLVGANLKKITLRSFAKHYGIRTEKHYLQKRMGYAFLCAVKYKQEKRKLIAAFSLLSPVFNFLKSYFFQFGFLDKRRGFIIAKINALYTRKKYQQLHLLLNEEKDHISFLQSSFRKIVSFLS